MPFASKTCPRGAGAAANSSWIGKQAREMVQAMTLESASTPPCIRFLGERDSPSRALERCAEAPAQLPTLGQPWIDQMAGWATARQLLAIRKLVDASAGGGPDLKNPAGIFEGCGGGAPGDHRVARMQMELERREIRGEQGAE